MKRAEANFDGLVGPTHNYAGLPEGNLASRDNRGRTAHPRQAALEGLAKMRALRELGLTQGILPPQERPHFELLRTVGFRGKEVEIIDAVWREAPWLLTACYSSSAMWAANAATVSPSSDTADGLVHFTPANLQSTLHRSLEPPATARALRVVFQDPTHFVHDEPLPARPEFGDEGAANHTRLFHGNNAVHLFVYGRSRVAPDLVPKRYPARQSREASEAIVRQHRHAHAATVFAQQSPDAIDRGVFHNDVIAVGHENVLLYHQEAFVDPARTLEELNRELDGNLIPVCVYPHDLSVDEAVRSYLFNSQLVTIADQSLALIAPTECRDNQPTKQVIDRILSDERNPIRTVQYLDVRESMQNGGGPACLRLRVSLTDQERDALDAKHLLTEEQFAALSAWVERHYRESLSLDDLRDPSLITETRTALDELTQLLALGSDFYPFQRAR